MEQRDHRGREVASELCVAEPMSLATGGGATRLFNKFLDADLVSQVGPTRILTPLRNLELPRHGGVEAWHLFALFDCALEGGFPTVVLDYVSQVCQDSQAVSSDPTESFLMNQDLVETWCEEVALYLRREFHSLVETVDPRSQDQQFLSKGLWLEKVFRGLQVIVGVLVKEDEGSLPAGNAARDRKGSSARSLLECSAQVSLALEACRTCNWSCHAGLNQMSRTSSPAKGGLQAAAAAQARSGRGEKAGAPTSFIQDLLSQLGLASDAYPFASFLDAVKKIFLSSRSGEIASKAASPMEKRVFLYYLMDIGCTRGVIGSFADHFNLSNPECSAIRAYLLLDSGEPACIEEACALLPGVSAHLNRTRVVQALIALGQTQPALDILRATSSGASSAYPTMEEALLTLECKGLYEGFLYCRGLWDRARNECKPGETRDQAERIARRCTNEWTEAHLDTKAKILELPLSSEEESCLPPSVLPIYLVMRGRFGEAREALKESDLDDETNDLIRNLTETALAALPQ